MTRLGTEEGGFTLVELLMALALGSMILTAVMMVFLTGIRATGRVTDRVEASQRSRLAMDRVITLLNSQTCVYASDGSSVPITDGQAQQVTFYANLGLVNADPIRYRLRYDSAAKSLYEDRWIPTRDKNDNAVYPAAISKTMTVGTNLVPTLAGGVVFQYFQFNPADGTIDPAPMATTAGLSDNDRSKAVRVGATFAALPEKTTLLNLTSTTVTGAATVGSAEGSDPTKGVNC
jgi:prepilin-type N-terminal cleavage/methylation domain-containing protein